MFNCPPFQYPREHKIVLDWIFSRHIFPRNSLGYPLSLRLNFTWTFLGNLIYAACQWGMLGALAKLGSPEMVGQFTLALAITAPIIMFTNLQLRVVQASDADSLYSFDQYLTLRILMTIVGFLVIAAISLGMDYSGQIAVIILVVGFAKCIEAISDVIFGLFQKSEQMDRIAISMMGKGILSLLGLTITIWTTRSVLWGSIILALTWLLILLVYDVRNVRRLTTLKLHWRIDSLWDLFKLSLPLGVVMMLISLNTNVPRYFVASYLGQVELGYFSASAYLLIVGSIVINALGQSAIPRLSQYRAMTDVKRFRALLGRLLVIAGTLGGGIVIVSILFGKDILAILYKPDYAKYSNVLILLMVAGAVGYLASFLGYAATALRRFNVQLPLFLVVTAGTAISSALLIPTFGIAGAAYAMIIGATLNLLGSALIVNTALMSMGKGANHATQ